MHNKSGPPRPARQGQPRGSTARPCRAAFDQARALRSQHPLPFGRYKLEEALRQLRKYADTAEAIRRLITGMDRAKADDLIGECVASERATWLKRLPAAIADLLGHNVVPAVEALDGDRLPRARIEALIDDTQRVVDRLVARCEDVHAQIQPSIEQEYAAMRSGRSLVAALVADAIALVEDQLALADRYRLRVVRSDGTAA